MACPLRPEKRCRLRAPPAPMMPGIPDDIMTSDVLLRLPVKTLMCVKAVSHSWLAAVEDPAFVRRHLQLSRARPPAMLVVPREEYYLDEDGPDDGISFHRLVLGKAQAPPAVELVFRQAWPEGIAHEILAVHCDGLVAVATATDQIFVCNPATREFAALPPASRDAQADDLKAPAVALSYDPWRGRYVVARYFYREHREVEDADTGGKMLDFDIGHEIFTLGGGASDSGGWELTEAPPAPIAPVRPICVQGAIYWATAYVKPSVLLRFSLRDRAFAAAPGPPGANFVHGMDHLTDLGGKLCYLRADSDVAYDVWVADDGPAPEWSLRCRVDFADDGPSVGIDALLPVADDGEELLFVADFKTLYGYNVRRKDLREVVDMDEELEYEEADGSAYSDDELVHHVVPYVESLVSIGKSNCY
ncbi:hypothetical protein ACP4OV_010199 [Aristida adscensionis]